MRPSGQQGEPRDHPATGEAQAQLEAVVVQLLSGTVPIVRHRLEAAVPPTAAVATDRQGQGINNLYLICRLPTHACQAVLNCRFDLPKVGGLSHEESPFGQVGKEVSVMGSKVGKEIFVGGEAEVFPANL